MAHHHKVPGLVPAVVKSMVIDVAENGTSTNPIEWEGGEGKKRR